MKRCSWCALIALVLLAAVSAALLGRAADPNSSADAVKPAVAEADDLGPDGRVYEALQRPISVDFNATPLREAIEQIGKQIEVPVVFDRRTIDRAGVDLEGPLTLHHDRVSVRSILRQSLHLWDLAFSVREGSLWIMSSAHSADSDDELVVRVYDVADLVVPTPGSSRLSARSPEDHLMDLITSTVAPPTWEDVGGRGTICYIRSAGIRAIVVCHTRFLHEQTAAMLEQLRAVRKGEPPADFRARPVSWTSPEETDRWRGVRCLTARERAAEKRFRKALATQVKGEFRNTPLHDVVAQLQKQVDMPMLIDPRALDDVGISTDTPITFTLDGLTLEVALKRMLCEMDLTYLLYDEVLLIITPEISDALLVTEIYDLSDLPAYRTAEGRLLPDYDQLNSLIQRVVAPTTWDDVGGPGSAAPFHQGGIQGLVVSQTPAVHNLIAELLAMIAKLRGPLPPAEELAKLPLPGRANGVEHDRRDNAETVAPPSLPVGELPSDPAGPVLAAAPNAPIAAKPVADADELGPDERVHEALQRSISVDFKETPLREAIEQIGKQLGVRVWFDGRAIDDVGIDVNESITLRLDNVSARAIVRHAVRPYDLAYIASDGVLTITTPEVADFWLTTRLYDVADLIVPMPGAGHLQARSPGDHLMGLISSTIAPTTWGEVGGPGSMSMYQAAGIRAIVVSQSLAVHEQTAAMLEQLRTVRKGEPPTKFRARPVGWVSREETDRWRSVRNLTASERAIEERFRKALATQVKGEFRNTPLQDVVAQLQKQIDMPMQIEFRALRDLAISTDTPITFTLDGLTLEVALKLMLRELDLIFILHDEVLLITTAEVADTFMPTEIYDLSGLPAYRTAEGRLLPDYDQLNSLIQRVVAPTTWDDVGGPGSAAPFHQGGIQAMVVSQTPVVHNQIAELLAMIAKVRGPLPPAEELSNLPAPPPPPPLPPPPPPAQEPGGGIF